MFKGMDNRTKEICRFLEASFRDYRLSLWADKEASRTRAKDIEDSVAASYAKRPNQRF